jgi:hypothetical protein
LDGAVAGLIGAAIVAVWFLFMDASLACLFTHLPCWEKDSFRENMVLLRMRESRFL